jgi:hypothetical protein
MHPAATLNKFMELRMRAFQRFNVGRHHQAAGSNVGNDSAFDRQHHKVEKELPQLVWRKCSEFWRACLVQVPDRFQHGLPGNRLVDGTSRRTEELQHGDKHVSGWLVGHTVKIESAKDICGADLLKISDDSEEPRAGPT